MRTDKENPNLIPSHLWQLITVFTTATPLDLLWAS